MSANTFYGFRRPDGRVGVRNHLLVLPTTSLVNRTCDLVQQARPDYVAVTHQDGSPGGDDGFTIAALSGFAANPNVAAVLLLGLGDDSDPIDRVAAGAEKLGARVLTLTVLEAGGVTKAADQAVEMLDSEAERIAGSQRESVDIAELILGTECGGSDGFSGLTGNPALGACSDLLVAAGGTSILAEMTELIGAEHLVARRAADPQTAAKLLHVVRRWEHFAEQFGEDIRGAQPSPGNQDGGLTTIEEKSLGCVYKGGTSPIVEVIGYGERPSKRGLVCMDTPGHDVEQLTGMAAGGAHIIAFTTGRGTPTSSPIVPTIKISTNSRIGTKFADHIDINAGTISDGEETIEQVGARIFEKVIAAASGEAAKAELFGQRDFALPRTAASV